MNKDVWIWSSFGCVFLGIIALSITEFHWLAYLGWFAAAFPCAVLHLLEIAFRKSR
jgi:tellurite resistance protein TehA-like permease